MRSWMLVNREGAGGFTLLNRVPYIRGYNPIYVTQTMSKQIDEQTQDK